MSKAEVLDSKNPLNVVRLRFGFQKSLDLESNLALAVESKA
jgi:hypothetical protein